MRQKLKSILVTFGALSLAMMPALVFALTPAATALSNTVNINNSLCSGTTFDLSGNTTNCNQGTDTSNFQSLLGRVINIFSIVVGVIAVIMIIVGGLRYITSGGDTSKVGGAKTTIIYALVGLVVVAVAQLIVHFVLNQATDLTNNTGGAGQAAQ